MTILSLKIRAAVSGECARWSRRSAIWVFFEMVDILTGHLEDHQSSLLWAIDFGGGAERRCE